MRMIDLSRELYHRTPTYPGQPPIIHGVWKTHEESFVESGNVHGNCVMFFSMPDHGGTHIDAPRHFGMSGTPIDEYPLENCYVKGICLDLRHITPKAEITPSDLEQAVKKSAAAIPKRGTVLLCTGHHARIFPTPIPASTSRQPRDHSSLLRPSQTRRSLTRDALDRASPDAEGPCHFQDADTLRKPLSHLPLPAWSPAARRPWPTRQRRRALVRCSAAPLPT